MGNNSSNVQHQEVNGWKQINDTALAPIQSPQGFCAINANQILYIAGYCKTHSNRLRAIFSYNINKNKWSKLRKYPRKLEINAESYAFNPNTNILYICNANYYGSDKAIITLDLSTLEWNRFELKTGRKWDMYTESIIVNNELHFIGGLNDHLHYKWDEEHNRMVVINDKLSLKEVRNEFKSGFTSHQIVYLESKQIVFAFGGMSGKQSFNHCTDYIHKYDVLDKSWSKMRYIMPMKVQFFDILLSSDDKYVIFLNRARDTETCDPYELVVFDVDNDRFFESVVEYKSMVPLRVQPVLVSNYSALLTPLLIHGLFRKYLREYKNMHYLPHDIVTIVISMYATDFIYVLDGDATIWSICVSDVLKPKRYLTEIKDIFEDEAVHTTDEFVFEAHKMKRALDGARGKQDILQYMLDNPPKH